DGAVRSPFAVDPNDPERKTVWGDLAELDYRPPQRNEIVAYFEALVRHYAGLGFGGFRCDAAYKVPAEVWRRLIGTAKSVDPEILFLAENLGATLDEVEALAPAGFDYLFNSVKWWDFESPWLLDQYDRFRHIAPTIGFPESHDTERLVTELVAAGFPDSEVEAHYRQAYAFAAAFSTGVMMPMGFEYGWARRISVVPLEVKVLHAALRPFRQVAIGPCDAGRKPAHHPAWRPDARVVIENVYPEIDGGRYPAKRIVGDTVEVWADLFRDGHDKLRAV